MQTINVKQGSNEWLAERAKPNTFTASESSAMMGESKYQTRTELLKIKKTGIAPEISTQQQALFDRGHIAEESARPIVETLIGEELYPTTGFIEIDGLRLLASFDGITLDESIVFEHKLWNEQLAETVRNGEVPDSHFWQLEHQLLVSGADKVIFVVSDGTGEKLVMTDYYPGIGLREKLISAWKQFSKDLETFEPEPEVIKAQATLVDDLLLPSIVVTGQIAVESNLELFGEVLHDFIGRINVKPETDEDFVNIGKAIKSLEKAEEWLDKQEEGVISKFDQLNQTIALKNTLKELARENRLMLQKIDKAEKENRKAQIVAAARNDLFEHHQRIQSELPVTFTHQAVNFADAIKGKKTISSMQDAVNTMLANAKIEADALARDLREKHTWYIENAGEYSFLFSDLSVLIYKDKDSFQAVAQNRILSHKEQERIKAEAAAKAQAEREERIRKEAEEKARREEQQRIAAEQAERERLERENQEELERATAKKETPIQAVDKPVQAVAANDAGMEASKLVSDAEMVPVEAEVAPSTFRSKAINIIAEHWEIDYSTAEQWLINEFSQSVSKAS